MDRDEPPPAPETGEVLGLLWRVSHALETLSKQMLRTHGVTGPQRLIINIVAARPGISAGEVAAQARIHPSTLSGILERLERGGLVLRTRDSADGRKARFAATEGGVRVRDRRGGTVEVAVNRSLAGLDEAERALVQRWLRAFGDELERERDDLARSTLNDAHSPPPASTRRASEG